MDGRVGQYASEVTHLVAGGQVRNREQHVDQPLGGRPVPVVRTHPNEPFPTEHPQVGLPMPCYFLRNIIILISLQIKAVAQELGVTPAQEGQHEAVPMLPWPH